MNVRIDSVVKHFGRFQALRNLSLEMPSGELVALLGPSGSGKTTLLRILAGLENADSGSIAFGDRDVTNLSPRDRKIGLVFQHYALFRNMNVFDNIAFGLRVLSGQERPSAEAIAKKVRDLIRLVQLDGFEKRFPSQLSGGQRQRVGLARALATDPKILLLDEPFGALDAQVRKELRVWLRDLHHRLNVTSIFVTHDQEEALEIADRIVVLQNGRIQQIGKPTEVFDHPASAFVAKFLGDVNTIQGEIRNHRVFVAGADTGHTSPHANGTIEVLVRPHDIEILAETVPSFPYSLPAAVESSTLVGGHVQITLRIEGLPPFHAERSVAENRKHPIQAGGSVRVRLQTVHVFPKN
jgi:sulfate transport system ATP-binding protein